MARNTTRTQSQPTTRSARGTHTARTARSKRPATGRSASSNRSKQNVVAEPALQEFLERMSSALTSGDVDTVAACFEYPAVMVMSDPAKYGPNHVLQDPQSARQVFGQAPQMYHERGIHDTFPDVEEVQRLADGLLLVRTRFPYIDADGNDLGDGETSIYLVREDPEAGEYAICAAVTLGTDADRGG